MLSHRLLIVTGKGGVGKTSVAAALAAAASADGKTVLAVELDPTGALHQALVGPVPAATPSFKPAERRPRLWSMSMDPEASLTEYLKLALRLPVIPKVGPLSAVFDFVADAAPGVREIVTMGKVCHEVRERHYDIVVVDAAATGHVLSQLGAPDAINQLVGVGLIRNQTEWMRTILQDERTTGVVAVTTPEEMPVTETVELIDGLVGVDVHLAAVVVNRVPAEPLAGGDRERFTQLHHDHRLLDEVVGTSVGPLLDSVARTIVRRRTADPLLAALLDRVAGVPTGFVPLLRSGEPGPAFTAAFVELLRDELDLVESSGGDGLDH